jgi:VWFA-related protein
MRRFPPRWLALALPLGLFAQQLAHEASVINIEVPVRVYKGGEFVDDLRLADFEITEDGVPQTPLAVYLVRKTAVAKKDERGRVFRPRVDKRNFVLLFELNEVLPEVKKAIDEFTASVLTPADSLIVCTPKGTYHFKEETYRTLSRKQAAEQLKSLLRKDVGRSSFAYRSLLKELAEIGEMPIEPEVKVFLYRNALLRLGGLKSLDKAAFVATAEALKKMDGQKFVFLFYQKETIPIPPGLDELELFEYRKDKTVDVEDIRRAFSDGSITAHFVYITKGMTDATGNREFRDNILEESTDIYLAFKDLTTATGGIMDSTSNALAGMRKMVEASEEYYLLYYAPAPYRADGSFREINVRVRGEGLTVSHRAGYVAD